MKDKLGLVVNQFHTHCQIGESKMNPTLPSFEQVQNATVWQNGFKKSRCIFLESVGESL